MSAAVAAPTTVATAPAGPPAGKRRRSKAGKDFLPQLKRLMAVVMPGIGSRQFAILATHSAFLVLRTFASIKLAQFDGEIVRALVERNVQGFFRTLLKWLALAVPSAYITSMIKFLEAKLALSLRTRLVNHMYEKYMDSDVYYRVETLDSRLSNVDQCLTEDASRFCSHVAHLYSHLSKPLLDVALMGGQIYMLGSNKLGKGSANTPVMVAAAVVSTSFLALKYGSPPFGRLAAKQADLEGKLRYQHSRVITNAEEIAFYQGHQVEAGALSRSYSALVKHLNKIYHARIGYHMLEGVCLKYLWNAAGYLMIALPNFGDSDQAKTATVSDRTQDFVIASGLLTKAADAVERIFSAYKEINELAGYMERVTATLDVFDDVKNGNFQKRSVTGEIKGLTQGDGVVHEASDHIKFADVPIVSPNGDILIEKLSFEIHPGQSCIVAGPNGCGKSSLFRILGGLWPATGGTVYRPSVGQILYIPQRPFLTPGTLREQIIFPMSEEEVRERKGFTDKHLEQIMEWVSLRHILEREGWEARREWTDVLSGGEKQRVGFARVFVHRPHFAILDESTSAVSLDVEAQVFTRAIDMGITLLTVSHRPSLFQYHNHILQFDGAGGWKFGPLDSSSVGSLQEEKSRLENELSKVASKRKRLEELKSLIG